MKAVNPIQINYFKFILLATVVAFSSALQGQVKIGTDAENVNPYAILELESDRLGLILPRLSNDQRDAAFQQNIPQGLTIYNTDENCIQYWDNDKWICSGIKRLPVYENLETLQASSGETASFALLNTDGENAQLYFYDGSSWINLYNQFSGNNPIGLSDTTSTTQVIRGKGDPSTTVGKEINEIEPGIVYVNVDTGQVFVATDNGAGSRTPKDGISDQWKEIQGGGPRGADGVDGVGITKGTSAPGGTPSSSNDLFINTNTGEIYTGEGNTWVKIPGTGTGSSVVIINQGPVTNEGPVTNVVSVTNQGPVTNENTVVNKGDVTNEGPVTNVASVTNQGPVTNENTVVNKGDVTNEGDVTNKGPVTNENTVVNKGAVTNESTVVNKGDVTNEGDVINQGSVINQGPVTNVVSVTNQGSVTNENTVVNKGDVTNEGAVTNNATTTLNGPLVDSQGNVGTSGQLLSSNGLKTVWIDPAAQITPTLTYGESATATETTIAIEGGNALTLQASGSIRFSQTGTHTLAIESRDSKRNIYQTDAQLEDNRIVTLGESAGDTTTLTFAGGASNTVVVSTTLQLKGAVLDSQGNRGEKGQVLVSSGESNTVTWQDDASVDNIKMIKSAGEHILLATDTTVLVEPPGSVTIKLPKVLDVDPGKKITIKRVNPYVGGKANDTLEVVSTDNSIDDRDTTYLLNVSYQSYTLQAFGGQWHIVQRF